MAVGFYVSADIYMMVASSLLYGVATSELEVTARETQRTGGGSLVVDMAS